METGRLALIAALPVVLALAASALGAAEDTRVFGSVLTVASPEVALELRDLPGAQVCYVDDDGSSGYTEDDPVVLTTSGGCTGNSRAGDLRLKTWGGNPAGERLGSANDAGVPVAPPPGNVRLWFFDANGNQRLDDGDTLYVNFKLPDTGGVDVGDLRLSPHGALPAGSAVRAGDADLGLGTVLLGTAIDMVDFVDIDKDNVFDAGEVIYVNADGGSGELVEFGDLRLVAVAQDRPFGSIVTFGDTDGSGFLTPVDRSPCFSDSNGSGGYDPGEPLYLHLGAACSAGAALGDVRLTASMHGAAGTRVDADSADENAPLTALTDARAAFLDRNGDAVFGPDDWAYIDVVSPGFGRVDVGDIRLTAGPGTAGHAVEIGDGAIGEVLRSFGLFRESVGFVSTTGGTAPTAADLLYLNVDRGTNEGVEPKDVRLVADHGQAFGAQVRLEDGDVQGVLRTTSAATCYTASSSGSAYRAGDSVYLALGAGCSGTAQVGMLRLVEAAGHLPGTPVRPTDADHGASVEAFGDVPMWKYVDANGNSEWDAGDTLFLDIVAQSADSVSVGDLRITAFGDAPGGTSVSSSHADLGSPLRPLGAVSGRTAFVDADHDVAFGAADFAYVDVRGDGGYVTVLDIRLTPLLIPQPGDEDPPTDPPQSPGPSGSPDPVDPDQSPGPEPEPSGSGPDDPDAPVRTPAPAIALVVVGLFLLARRLRPL